MNKKIISAFTLSVFLSCSHKEELSINPLDYIAETISIPIDLKTETYTRTLQYFEGDLYWWNSDRETISVFDLSRKKLKNTLKMEREGPNGLGNPIGFFVLNRDSIYVPTIAFELRLIDPNGNLLNTYNYFSHSKLAVPIPSMTRYSNMLHTDYSESLYLGMRDLGNVAPSNLNEQALIENPPILSFNKSLGTFDYLEFRLPSSFVKFDNFINISQTSTSKSLLLLHRQSNTLIEIDFNGVNYKEYQLETDLINSYSNEYYYSPRMSRSIEENLQLMHKSSENLGLVFDPYKNLLYRFGWPGEDISMDKNAMKFGYTPRYFTISIYDGIDYSLIKEFTLPKNTYLAHHYFVSEKGLNLFPMHPDNPEFDENYMVIHTFDFSNLVQ
ncbi:DUF4221 family protein [Cecembia sp.]|uniref:DUF4221 family protein n=1 Tax=Cecembia sp. TaxID=1898110 RepID=UPI0025B92701|nr:DUF4221 family protein [Cecembia sp.]